MMSSLVTVGGGRRRYQPGGVQVKHLGARAIYRLLLGVLCSTIMAISGR